MEGWTYKILDIDLPTETIEEKPLDQEMARLFKELTGTAVGEDELARSTTLSVACMIDQSHNVEGKLTPMILSVLDCQEAYDKSLLLPRQKLAAKQQASDVLTAHHLLTEVYRTDVRPLHVKVREEMGVPVDPIDAYLSSGYEEKIAAERGTADTGGGYQS